MAVYHIEEPGFVLRVDIIPYPLLSAIVPQLFLPRHLLYIFGPQDFVSALKTGDDRYCVFDVPSFPNYEILRYANFFQT